MKKIYTALITPFKEDESIDYEGFKRIIKSQIEENIDGFILCGTTGESCTLNEEEKFSLLAFLIEEVKGRVEIFFGCGNNNTKDTLRLCRKAQNYPIDGVLLVTPYYNKPTQRGLYEHYSCIANNTILPILLYQVESRCNCVFTIDTLKKLTRECPTIIGLKYASKDIDYAALIKKEVPSLKLYCGDDSLILECDQIGMDGSISVIAPLAMKELKSFYREENQLEDFFFKRISKLLFIESNPIGIKYVLSKRYGILDKVRLPLTCLEKENKKLLDAYFDK